MDRFFLDFCPPRFVEVLTQGWRVKKTRYSNCYDYYFQRYALDIFAARADWCWFKAMALAESGLNPVAISPVGAVGVMQLMPDTANEMAEKLGIEFNPLAPHLNIQMGINYARQCWDIWKEERGTERIRFMLGSYNAGPANIIKAQNIARSWEIPTDTWQSIVDVLQEVTGGYAKETIAYVGRVEKYYREIAGKELCTSS